MNQTKLDECAKRLKECREENHFTLEEIGNKIGVHKSTILRWENGETGKIKSPILKDLADLYNVNVVWLMGYDVPKKVINMRSKHVVKIPVLGKVAGGTPIEAISNIDPDEYIEIDEDMAKKGDMFGLIVKGQSMFPYILENDVVVVQKQDDCESGKVAVVMINGDEATVKVVKKKEDGLDLESYNPVFPTFHFSSQQVIDKPVKIIGIVRELRRRDINM